MTLEEIRRIKDKINIKPDKNVKPVVLPEGFWDDAELRGPPCVLN